MEKNKIVEKIDNYYIVQTKYGLCKQQIGHYNSGKNATIQSALDKNEYFRKQCLDKFGIEDNDDLSQIEYINNTTKIKVIDKFFGDYYITPNSYLSGRRSYKKGLHNTALKQKLDVNLLKEKLKKIHPELEVDLSNYKTTGQSVNVITKYGICNVKINHLLRGIKPTIKSAINKNEYFINQAKEVHGDLYDYSLVNYTNTHTKVKIISNYGVFEQTPANHLIGQGCPILGKERTIKTHIENPVGWSVTNWGNAANKSNNFTGFKVYLIELENKNERFFKIGRTYRDINKRIHGIPYQCEILTTFNCDTAKDAFDLESQLKKVNKEYKYLPLNNFDGKYECFSELNIPQLNAYIN